MTAIKKELKENADYNKHETLKINQQIELMQKRLSKLLDLYTDGNIDKKSYDTKNNQYQYELDELLVLQEKINKTLIKYVERARDVFELCKNAREWYLQANNEKKREILKLLHSNFLYDGEKPHFELNSVFKLISEFNENEKHVDEVTIFEPVDSEIVPQKTLPNNTYQRIVYIMKQSTQEYYNMRIVLGLKCA